MQKIIVTHKNPDWDAITSVWILKKFLPGWGNANVEFVNAGERLELQIVRGPVATFPPKSARNGSNADALNAARSWSPSSRTTPASEENTIEIVENKEIIHVDTGMGPLDHHQTSDMNTCATSLCWFYVKAKNPEFKDMDAVKIESINKIVKYVILLDHFQEVYFPDAASDIYEFALYGLIEGFKMEFPNDDNKCLEFGFTLLNAVSHRFEQKIWAENEIKEKGIEFETRFGKAMGIESLNDEVVKLGQKMGFVIVIRKDPRKGYARVKAIPEKNLESRVQSSELKKTGIDLTPVYERLKEKDPAASWFLHVSKKMLLNGSAKNPKMKATKLNLKEIIEVVKEI